MGGFVVKAWSILFPDGSAISADSPEGILARIAQVQWEPCSIAQVRARLVDRAFVWSGVMVPETGGAAEFLQSLADVGMFVLAGPPVGYNEIAGEIGSPRKGD